MSHATCSENTAELLSRFQEKQAQRDENHVEVGAIFGACFVYHLTGCDRCSSYLEHLLEDMEQHPAKFSFSKDEILKGLHEAWPHELEAQLVSLQPSTNLSERISAPADTTDAPVGSAHPLYSPPKVTYSCKRSRKLDENENFRNRVLKPEVRPDHWLLHMWQALVGWHKNPMSVPNAIRDDADSYFLKEDIDVAAWLNKIIAETPVRGFNSNSLRPGYQQTQWITDSSTPIRLCSQIVKGTKDKAQTTEPVRLPQGSEFLALILKHCSLSREQIDEHIIPYMERDEEKCPMSAAASERATYLLLTLRPPASHKGKRPMTGASKPRSTVHAPTPAKTGESSQQRLDVDLDSYNQVREPVLPYEEAPPSSEPETGDNVPLPVGTSSTLHNESTMDIDQEFDIYS
ncbi:hypothetical protein M422DRAFT_258913 [Sphaerobolus stellatus SS14]|uniref:Uncharacterized protein n=1 Tax=Sphaerobolus stellatus (strain SS14) TaxID=990650 RepID=A0A0C9VAF1_SPHS4|nr:hypothetical protein M422DRAFT_258913 [Sphaerobolus stellatus SS14]